MKYGPDIAGLAALVGDPARANMLTALMNGAALTASELADEAGVTKQTASAHLSRLAEAEFVAVEKQGRHRYFRLSDPEVAQLLEQLMGLAARRSPARARPGPREPALRKARICYDHLAGDLGVALYDALTDGGWLRMETDHPILTKAGAALMTEFGIDLDGLGKKRRPLCRKCLDWSVRRNHLAGALGAALLDRFNELGWARRVPETRIIDFSPDGEEALRRAFAIPGGATG